MHDLFQPHDPPERHEIPIYAVSDRIGSPLMVVDRRKIVGVVRTNQADETSPFSEPTAETRQIGVNVAEFLVGEMRAGRVPRSFLPLQSGVGDIANSVLAAIGGHPEIPAFQMYTEVLQDSVIGLIEQERCSYASTCSLTLSPEAMKRVVGNLDFFRG